MDGLVKRFFQALPLVLISLMSASANEAVSSFQQALEQTEKVQGPERGSCTEQAGIRRFEDFLAHLDEKTAREDTE